MANGKAACRIVKEFLVDDERLDLGPDQAEDGIGLNVPDYVSPNAVWGCVVSGTDDPSQVECTIAALEGDWQKKVAFEVIGDDKLGVKVTLPDLGLYRITVQSDYDPFVTQLDFAGPDGQDHLDD
ncbi:hypothetical protein ACIF83_40165 [Streptomyces sp. NPDC085866]|uniref:hypothetical protein n=1 Tax=Streptomyces sp. NPDC085866 TaxID=3365736 RepID=UPI0037CDCBD3